MANLFEKGKFISHSGETLSWKIECDVLTNADMLTMAELVHFYFSPFSEVIGIPFGGTRLANALQQYVCNSGPTLIVDDVLTTGKSMEDTKRNANGEVIGVVLFARREPPQWVTPIFRLDSKFLGE